MRSAGRIDSWEIIGWLATLTTRLIRHSGAASGHPLDRHRERQRRRQPVGPRVDADHHLRAGHRGVVGKLETAHHPQGLGANPQGLQTLQVTPERLLEVNREIENSGVRVLQQWALLGPYDILSVLEAPDDNTIMAISADMAARGSAQVETMAVVDVDTFVDMFD